MNLLQRLRKRGPSPATHAQPHALTHSGYGGGWSDSYGGLLIGGGRLPGSDHDWQQEVGEEALNYAVAGCLRWLADNISEPCLVVERRNAEGEWDQEPFHPFLDFMTQPNEEYDGESLLTAAAWDYSITGRGYQLKERDNLGRLRSLWWAPWYTVTPRFPSDGSQFITDYLYRPAGQGRGIAYKKADVVHYRWGLDHQTGGRLGVHRTRPFLPAMAALNEGMVYTPTVLRNMGIVPSVLMVRGKVGQGSKDGLREWFNSLFTRDNRGKPGVLEVEGDGSGGTGSVGDIKQLGLSPEQLALDKILDRPEIIVCNAFGIHPGVLYLGASGGKGFDNGGQLAEARRASYHDCLIPLLKRFALFLTRSVLSEFEIDGPNKVRCRFDFGDVEALQEDQTELYKRNTEGVQGGWLRVSEAREKAKLKVKESDAVYLRKQGVTAVLEADENPEPASSGSPLDGTDTPDPADEEQDNGED